MNIIRCQNKREVYEEINILRGISIVLVVLGHSFIGENNNILIRYVIKVIYSFHMPIFFFVSGFLAIKIFNLDNIIEKFKFLKNKFIKLMIPYFLVTLLAIPIKLVMNSFVKRKIEMSEVIIDMFVFPNKNPVASLWFIYTLFIIFFIAVICNKIKVNKMIYISLTCLLISAFFKVEFMNIYGVFRNLVFFYLGLLIRITYKLEEINNSKNNIRLFIFTLSLILFINIFFVDNPILIEIVYLFTGVFGIFMGVFLSRIIYKNINLNKILCKINKYALPIYLFSWFTQNCIGYVGYKILNIRYSIVIIFTFIAGFMPIIIYKYTIRKINS